MWYPPVVTTAAASEPVTLADAIAHLNLSPGEDDAKVEATIAAARAAIESQCGTRLMQQTVQVKCDGWGDMARLEVAPVQAIASIAYVDATGAEQTLSADVFDLRAEGDSLDPAVVLKYGQRWPATRPGSRITVTAAVGYTLLPPEIKHAALLLVGYWYDVRTDVNIGNIVNKMPHGVPDLLSNHKRGV